MRVMTAERVNRPKINGCHIQWYNIGFWISTRSDRLSAQLEQGHKKWRPRIQKKEERAAADQGFRRKKTEQQPIKDSEERRPSSSRSRIQKKEDRAAADQGFRRKKTEQQPIKDSEERRPSSSRSRIQKKEDRAAAD
ncbi:hypothetical protein RB195_018442 [Necator americanus]|uniref:Uncharacterized protein n=1 Tax=Necator americanus TaxID=51031 RepID=A0ABR1C9V5_NECAM